MGTAVFRVKESFFLSFMPYFPQKPSKRASRDSLAKTTGACREGKRASLSPLIFLSHSAQGPTWCSAEAWLAEKVLGSIFGVWKYSLSQCKNKGCLKDTWSLKLGAYLNIEIVSEVGRGAGLRRSKVK